MTGVLHDAGETEARMDLRSIPLQSYVDAGEHGLFLKLTPDTFVPVKIDANGDTIGWGTTIHVDEFPDISLKKLPGEFPDDTAALFSESQGRILASVALKNAVKFETMMAGTSFAKIGKVTADQTITIRGKKKAALPISEALRAYRSTFKDY